MVLFSQRRVRRVSGRTLAVAGHVQGGAQHLTDSTFFVL
jgi:hypothetical protein